MKKIIILLIPIHLILVAIICGFSCASCIHKQNGSENDTIYAVEDLDPDNIHFQFMGIPIHGTPEQFGKALEDKGFYNSLDDPHYGEYRGKFYDSYVDVKIGYEDRDDLVYEVEAKFENYSISERHVLLESLIEKYSDIGAHIMEDADGDYKIIVWTDEGMDDHEDFNSGFIVPREVKGIIVFENDGDNLTLRYIDALNKYLHLLKEDSDL